MLCGQLNGELVRTTLPGSIIKKMDALRSNHRKVEIIMYDLALIKAGKGARRVEELPAGEQPDGVG
jgi:hypothetical protein